VGYKTGKSGGEYRKQSKTFGKKTRWGLLKMVQISPLADLNMALKASGIIL
jgi:hypothetical protein